MPLRQKEKKLITLNLLLILGAALLRTFFYHRPGTYVYHGVLSLVNNSSVRIVPPNRPGANAITNVADYARTASVDFQEAETIGKDIVEALTGARQQVRDEAAAANAPKIAVTCPFCCASTIPDALGRCEYCGGSVNG